MGARGKSVTDGSTYIDEQSGHLRVCSITGTEGGFGNVLLAQMSTETWEEKVGHLSCMRVHNRGA